MMWHESCLMTHQTFQLMTSVIFPREVRLLHQHRKRIQFCHIRSVPLGRLLINSRISLGTLKILVHMLPIMLRSYKILQDRKVLSYLYRFLKEILELKEFLVLSFLEFKASPGIQWGSMKNYNKWNTTVLTFVRVLSKSLSKSTLLLVEQSFSRLKKVC